MMTAQELYDYSWEKLPAYGNAPNMSSALLEETGTCLHRSRIIGGRALELGYPALRSITFGASLKAIHFSNFVKIGDAWSRISTGRAKDIGSVLTYPAEFDPRSIYAFWPQVGFELLDYSNLPQYVPGLAIPEQNMGYFRDCFISREYIIKAEALNADSDTN